MRFELKLKKYIWTCRNTCEVYVLQGVPRIAGEWARAAASAAFEMNPGLRDEGSL